MSDIREVTMWITGDNEKHYSREAAERWQHQCDLAALATERFRLEGISLLAALQVAGIRVSEEVRAALSRVIKDTALVISHWQCREQPGYAVREIKRNCIPNKCTNNIAQCATLIFS